MNVLMIYLLCIMWCFLGGVSAAFNINYIGFTPSTEFSAAVTYVYGILEQYINVSYTINVAFYQKTLSSNAIVAQEVTPFYCNHPTLPNIVISPTLFVLLNNGEGCVGNLNTNHIVINLNTATLFPLYVKVDGRVPAGYIDLVTALLHETVHGLGFESVFLNASGYYALSPSIYYYDYFIFKDMVTLPMASAFPLADAGVLERDLYFSAGNPPVVFRVYTPSRFATGTSITHTEHNTLMHYKLSPGYAAHCLPEEVLSFLANVGYLMKSTVACTDVISGANTMPWFLINLMMY